MALPLVEDDREEPFRGPAPARFGRRPFPATRRAEDSIINRVQWWLSSLEILSGDIRILSDAKFHGKKS
jgi:hypothetical protein